MIKTFWSNKLSECIQRCIFVLFHEDSTVVVMNEDGEYWLLVKGNGTGAAQIQSIAVGHSKPIIETSLAQKIFQDTELEIEEEFVDESYGIYLGKYDRELYELEKPLRLTLEIKEFEQKRRQEISQLIHPELSKFWDYKFFEISKNIFDSVIKNNITPQKVFDLFHEEMSKISQEKKMYFSCDKSSGNKGVLYYLNFPYLGNDDSTFRIRLCVEIVKNKILIRIEPHVTERGLSFNLDSYKEALEIIKELCNEDLEPLNQSVIQIIDKVWVNYRNKENALSTIELILKQKGIKYELFPENLSVNINYFVPIINKTISTRVYYREFNDNPDVLHEIVKWAKS